MEIQRPKDARTETHPHIGKENYEVIMASDIARGRVRATAAATAEFRNMVAVLQFTLTETYNLDL